MTYDLWLINASQSLPWIKDQRQNERKREDEEKERWEWGKVEARLIEGSVFEVTTIHINNRDAGMMNEQSHWLAPMRFKNTLIQISCESVMNLKESTAFLLNSGSRMSPSRYINSPSKHLKDIWHLAK